jgi:ferredoxin
MKGTSKVRQQGYKDPLLVEVMKRHGLDEIPLYAQRPPETEARRDRWFALGKVRDGEVAAELRAVEDPAAMAAEIKAMAKEFGASAVGIARLTPIMIDQDSDLPHDSVICAIVGEDYEVALKGPRAIETESTSTYVVCAEISTEIAKRIRAWGYPAVAHHNGGCDIQAIPAMYAAGLGELGKHGSLIHPELGASHRPGIVTTTLPLVHDTPNIFGVQDTCLKCNLCTNNCPADAIPKEEFVITEGVRRWITDVEKCYTMSRLRPQYCHICVDACPYIHMANGDAHKKDLFKQYMAMRKKAGYKTPAWFVEEAEEVLGV